MKHRSLVSALPFLVCLSIVSGCHPSDSHPHDHEQPPSAAAELEPETKTVFGDRTLHFMEHPPLVRGSQARFLAHLTVSATGEPIRAGKVRLEIGSTVLVADAPKRDGLFVPEGAFMEPGTHRARLSVVSEQVEETLDLGDVHVYADAQTARQVANSAVEVAHANEIPFLMEQQWRVKLLVAEASPQSLSKRLTIPAVAMLPEGAAAIVSPPTSGRLHGPPSGRLPRTGERVEQGQLLGMVEPPLTASDVAQLQALNSARRTRSTASRAPGKARRAGRSTRNRTRADRRGTKRRNAAQRPSTCFAAMIVQNSFRVPPGASKDSNATSTTVHMAKRSASSLRPNKW